MSGDVLRLLRIHGRVQGVGYRAFVSEHARRLSLGGWARNRNDGTVEALVAGQAAAIERLLIVLRNGLPGGRVTHIDETDATPDALRPGESRFEILPTL